MIEKIELTLIDLSPLYKDENGDGNHHKRTSTLFEQEVDSILESVPCCNATAALPEPNNDNNSDTTMATRSKLRHDILRFLKQRDAHLALASILLKSRAFHVVTQKQQAQHHVQQERPLMDLPRTKHKKPFILCFGQGGGHDEEEEDKSSPISLSHQFPFCGLVRFVPNEKEATEKKNNIDVDTDELLLGLDIVCFDIVQPRNTDHESFVTIFKDNFAPSEWNILRQSAAQPEDCCSILHEFCIRWAVKEAYTKALGVGLGFDFAPFQVIFDDDNGTLDIHHDNDSNDNNDNDMATTTKRRNPFLWKWLLHNANKKKNSSNMNQQHQQTLVGTVLVSPPKQSPGKLDPDLPIRPRREEWMFSFQLLYKQQPQGEINDDDETLRASSPFGCACTAWGPLPTSSDDASTTATIRVDNQWTTVDELVDWHVNAK